MPALARLKRAVRAGVGICGGVDGAAATADRSRSVAGDWNNLNHAAFPPLDCALALDEVAIALDRAPPIVSALARELGGVFVRLPQADGADGAARQVMAIAQEFGELAAAVSAGLNDGTLDRRDAARALDELHDLDGCCAALRLTLDRIARGDC